MVMRNLIAAAVVLGLTAGALAQKAPKKEKPKHPTTQEIEKITAAAPAKATATPKKPRKLLAFTKWQGFQHTSINVCAAALEIMGKKTGAWETVISNDIAMFEPQSLAQFDAVFFCSTTGDIFGKDPLDKLPKEQAEQYARVRKALLDFVASGKGIGGSHAATDCCYTWTEFGDLMGGYFSSHPYSKIFVKLDDPTHPINAAFKGEGFAFQDEMYVFGDKTKAPGGYQPYSRKNVRVLLSIDNARTKAGPDPKFDPAKGGRSDQDYAISWVKKHGEGRVFYCSFGHQHQIFWTPAVLQPYMDGVQFILGDLEADATPR